MHIELFEDGRPPIFDYSFRVMFSNREFLVALTIIRSTSSSFCDSSSADCREHCFAKLG